MKGEEISKLILDGLLIAGGWYDYAHVGSEGIHILDDEDPALLGLIPVHIKSSSEVLHLVL